MLHYCFYGVLMAMSSVIVLTSQYETHRGSDLLRRSLRGISGIGGRMGCFARSKFLCSDVRMSIYAFSVFLLGLVFGVIDTFVMFRMDEIGCKGETPMGVMMLVRFIIEAIFLVKKDSIVYKHGKRHIIFVSFAFTFIGSQCFLYAHLKDPWMFIIPEVMHGMSRTMYWIGIHSLIEILSNAESERKIKRFLEGFHLRIGTSLGALIGGAVYFGYGAQAMFYGSASICGLLLLLVPLCDRVAPASGKKTQYSIVLLEDDEFRPLKSRRSALSGSESDSDEEEDWYSRAEKIVDKEMAPKPMKKLGASKKKTFNKYGAPFNNNTGE